MNEYVARKVMAGWWNYRGVDITKHTKGWDEKYMTRDPRDTFPTGWYVSPTEFYPTLAAAKAAVDKKKALEGAR